MQIQSKKYDMGIEKFFDILEEVKKEEQTTIETLLAWSKDTWFTRLDGEQKDLSG